MSWQRTHAPFSGVPPSVDCYLQHGSLRLHLVPLQLLLDSGLAKHIHKANTKKLCKAPGWMPRMDQSECGIKSDGNKTFARS